MDRGGPTSLMVPMSRMSGLAVPMAQASALSIPASRTSRTSDFSTPTPKASNARASAIGGSGRDPESYMADIQTAAEAGLKEMEALVNFMTKTDRGGSRLSYTNMNRHSLPKSTTELLKIAERDAIAGNFAVCVVENISPALVKTLGAAWDLEPEFFALHVSNPSQDRLWQHYGEWKPPSLNDKEAPLPYDTLDGIYEFYDMDLSIELMQRSSSNYCQRHIFKDGHWPVNVSTRISYARVFPNLYMFLVDPPVRYEHAIRGEVPDKAIPTLRFPYARNRGGILMPSPSLGKPFVPFTALERIFRHAWQIELLFQPEEFFPNVPFLYIMSFSLWYSRLHRLDKDIKRISFNDIRNPDINITNVLHDLRESLSNLMTAVSNTHYHASYGVARYYQELWADFPYTNMLTPLDGHQAISKSAFQLHQFLLETFQLLTSTINVRDSQMSIRQTHESLIQTRQSVILTRLAAFYLPWTLASGIYGMNLKQLNASGLSIWVFVVTGAALVLGTIIVFQLQLSSWQPETYLTYFKASYWRRRFSRKPYDEDL